MAAIESGEPMETGTKLIEVIRLRLGRAGGALLAGALATALVFAATPGVAFAKKAEQGGATLQITVVPEIGEPVPKEVTLEEVEENRNYGIEGEEEFGMTVARLAGVVGIAAEEITYVTVSLPRGEESRLPAGEAVDPVELPGGRVGGYYAAFQPYSTSAIRFFSPPEKLGEELQHRSVTGAGDGPVFVTLEVEGGLLQVSPPAFSPSAPDAGTTVSFEPPQVKHSGEKGKVTNPKYSWTFGEGEPSELAKPTHRFEPKGPKGTYTYSVQVVVTGSLGGNTVTGVGHVTVPVTVTQTQAEQEEKEQHEHEQKEKEQHEREQAEKERREHEHEQAQKKQREDEQKAKEQHEHEEQEPNAGKGNGGGSSDNPGTGLGSGIPNAPASGSLNTPSAGGSPGGVPSARTLRPADGSSDGSGGHSPSKRSAPRNGSSADGRSRGTAHPGAASANGSSSGEAAQVHDDTPTKHVSGQAHATSATSGLVGVLLESGPHGLPAALLEGEPSPSEPAIPSLPGAARGSGAGRDPVGLLGWVAGILAVVVVVCAGGLAELQPRASYRRLAAR